MNQSILLPMYALFIGGCSGIIGTFYMRSLPAFPLTAWWWQWGQRFETSHPNLFKAIWVCSDCFSGHLGWVSFFILTHGKYPFTFTMFYTYLFCIALAAAAGTLSSNVFNNLYDKK